MVVVALAVGVVDVWRIVTLDGPDLAGRYLADDSFYYFELASRFPLAEFNEGITTTGFHPLWWVMLSPVFAVASGFAAIRVAMMLALAVHIAAGVALREVTRRRFGDVVSVIVGVAWIAHPAVRSLSLIAVESAVVAVCLFALIAACARPATPWVAVGVGALVGACFLARTDSIVATVPVVAVWWWGHRRRLGRGAVIGLGSAAAIVATPWLVFSVLHGGLRQDSARALTVVREAVGSDLSTMEALSRFIPDHMAVIGWPFSGTIDVDVPVAVLVIVAAVLTVRLPPRLAPIEVALLAGVAALHVAQAATLGGMREWYAVYLYGALFVVAVPRLAALVASRSWVLAPVVVVGLLAPPIGWFPQERGKVEAAERVPVGRLASFNTGIFQYVSDAEVLNLDGVVNPEVLPFLERGDICGYLREVEVEWLIDSDNGLRKLDALIGVGEVRERELLAGGEDPVYLFRVECFPPRAVAYGTRAKYGVLPLAERDPLVTDDGRSALLLVPAIRGASPISEPTSVNTDPGTVGAVAVVTTSKPTA